MPLTNLKPALYRVGEAQEARSGWVDPKTGNISDTADDDLMSVQLVPQARLAFAVGQIVEFTKPVDVYPMDCIQEGERAHVAYMDNDTGEVGLYLEAIHDGLALNTLPLVPFHDEETLASVRAYERRTNTEPVPVASPSLWRATLRHAITALIAVALWEGVFETALAAAVDLPHPISIIINEYF